MVLAMVMANIDMDVVVKIAEKNRCKSECKKYLELGLISTFISMTGKVLSKDNSKCRHNSIGYIGNKNMFFK